MQLAQYVATIANNGVRVAPRIVEGIYGNNDKGGLGDLIQQLQPTEMNKVNISDSDMSILHQGFYQVAHGTSGLTTGRAFSNGALVSISGKKQVQPKAMWQMVSKQPIPMRWPMPHLIIPKSLSQWSFLIIPI